MSRSCRRISFSRRSRLSSTITSSVLTGSAIAGTRSRLLLIQRVSVESPTPRSSAICRFVRPLVPTSRTASSSNSFVNRFCFVIEFAFHIRGTLHFSEASPVSAFPEMGLGSSCTSSFSRLAQRSLTLRPAHSHGHLRDRHPGASNTSLPPCLPGCFRLQLLAGWDSHPLKNAAFARRTQFRPIIRS